MATILQDWVTHQAQTRPEAVAVVHGPQVVTYSRLEQCSNQLARALRSAGCRRGDRVGLFLPKSPDAIIGLLGALKAGCVYVPLDPGSPAPRLRRIVDSCEPRCILAAGATGAALDALLSTPGDWGGACVGWMEAPGPAAAALGARFSRTDIDACSAEPPPRDTRPDDAAHILFTSGSTGTPKGVVIRHENVVHFVDWAVDQFQIGPDDRLSGHPPLHFDLSTFDMFGAFAAGAELHLVPQEVNLLPHRLAEFIRGSALTQWFSVPSILNYMAKFDVVASHDFPSLRRLLWCGEVFPTPALRYWMQRLPHVRFTNLYGPTEATIASSYYEVPVCPADDQAIVPIGAACRGEELLVLDPDLKPVPPGETGALYIGGVGLSPGYWRDRERTAEVFLPHPLSADAGARIYNTGDLARVDESGLVYFLGRADSQIKSRGYRIELGEIETAMNSLGLTKECAVVAVETGGFEGMAICCAYVPGGDGEIAPKVLRRELGRLVPGYMLPAHWLGFELLPKNGNGKIDRRRLREAFQEAVRPAGAGRSAAASGARGVTG